MFAVDGHGLELTLIAETFQRQQPSARVGRVTGDAAKSLGLGQLRHGRVSTGLGGVRARQGGQLTMATEGAQGRDGLRRGPDVSGQRHQPVYGGVAGAGVAVVACDGRQRVGISNTGHGRTAHARVVVFGSHLGEHIGVAVAEGLHGLQTNGRVAVLPLGLGTELIENAHGFSVRPVWSQAPGGAP